MDKVIGVITEDSASKPLEKSSPAKIRMETSWFRKHKFTWTIKDLKVTKAPLKKESKEGKKLKESKLRKKKADESLESEDEKEFEPYKSPVFKTKDSSNNSQNWRLLLYSPSEKSIKYFQLYLQAQFDDDGEEDRFDETEEEDETFEDSENFDESDDDDDEENEGPRIQVNFTLSVYNSETCETGFIKLVNVASVFQLNNDTHGSEYFVKEDAIALDSPMTITLEMNIYRKIENSSFLSVSLVMNQFFNNETYSDITLVIEDKQIFAHKIILSTHSKVFHTMFQSQMAESRENKIVLNEKKYKPIEEMIQFMYCGEIKKASLDLLVVANYYDVEELKILCEEVLGKDIHFKNAIEIFAVADKYQATTLKSKAKEFISENFKDIFKNMISKDLEKLDNHILVELMKIFAEAHRDCYEDC